MSATITDKCRYGATKPLRRDVLAHKAATIWKVLRRKRQSQQWQITCSRGVVWLTIENDARDYLVSGGETFCFQARGRVVAQGLGDAVFCLTSCKAAI